jgi:hypothetical protein
MRFDAVLLPGEIMPHPYHSGTVIIIRYLSTDKMVIRIKKIVIVHIVAGHHRIVILIPVGILIFPGKWPGWKGYPDQTPVLVKILLIQDAIFPDL